jgi:hypothetical protein
MIKPQILGHVRQRHRLVDVSYSQRGHQAVVCIEWAGVVQKVPTNFQAKIESS